MMKSIFNKILIFSLAALATSCSLETNIKGEFLLENNFKMVKEFENDEQCSEDDRWFLFASTFTTHSDETYELILRYKNGDTKEFKGNYKIYVGSEGHSGDGYFNLEDEKLDISFQKSYFLIFELPAEYNPSGYETSRVLYFQRW